MIKKNILNLFIPVVVLMILVVPFLVQAQTGGTNTQQTSGGTNTQSANTTIKIENPFKKDTIRGLIETIVKDILMPIGGVVAVLMIMYAGFLYVTAGGDPGQIKKAHDALLWAVIGAAILLGAWVISEAISKTIDQLRV